MLPRGSKTPCVEDTEILYRQVSPNANPIYFDPHRAPPIHRNLFLPAPNDNDGLSLIRSRFRTEIWSAYRPQQPDTRYRLACVKQSVLVEVACGKGFASLDFKPTPDVLDEQHGEPWAHCVIREINRTDYDNSIDRKKAIKEWALAVANGIASDAVIGPFQPPTPTDRYRPKTVRWFERFWQAASRLLSNLRG
jgi:hypothetical protein